MRTNPLAWLSLVLGVLAVPTCGATAPFALFFGFLALRRVHRSDGGLPGARAARAGMILGALGVVFFFVGLFVVGLYHLRDKSELTVCTNNLRRVGLAVNLYPDNNDHPHFPPGTIVIPEIDPDRRLSWMVSILPYMEAEPTPGAAPGTVPAAFQRGETLYARFDLKKDWHAEVNQEATKGAVAWYTCPAAARRPAPGQPAPTQYVGMAGFGTDAPTLAKTDPRAGFFGYDRVISRADLTRGAGETIMVTERADAIGPWARGGPATVTGVDPNRQPFVPRQFGGLHPHGANTLFADGHVTFITDRADPLVWEEQCRINP